MAKEFSAKTLILVLDNGKKVRKSIKNIDSAVSEDILVQVANLYGELSTYPLLEIYVDEDYLLNA
ncbi:MAG: hypothetical protein GX490_00675 [Bacilli bacterium]|nr:hypothetical protein [Bacilli bacterium]